MLRTLVATICGFLLGFAVEHYRVQHVRPETISPLKVTIIDDGGAHLKVESTVVQK